MSQPTPGPWKVVRDMRTDSKGKKYGLEVAAYPPENQRRAWESSGYIPLCDLFRPSNPIRMADYASPIGEEIEATREANARLIAQAPALREALHNLAYGGVTQKDIDAARAVLKACEE